MEGEKSVEEGDRHRAIAFAAAREADRRIAGVAAAARAVHGLAEAGVRETWLIIGDERPLAPATLADIARLRGASAVHVVAPAGAPPELEKLPPPAMDVTTILRGTAKPGDGIVSRHLNRPISQRITRALLAIPAARPIHATIASALFAFILLWGMLAGGKPGLILGAILFQTASVIDGVDGEMARATFRTSALGATLDSAVDMMTNFLFLLGLTVHLGRHGPPVVLWAGLWSLAIMVVGGLLVGMRSRAGGAPLSFDLLKRARHVRGPFDLVFRVMQALTSRDCYAFLFMILIIAGLAQQALLIGALVGTVWMLYVFATLVLPWASEAFRDTA
ncbi:MAG: CDP-alcohol phosphatidyltransferase family protein [Sphingomonadaceae bacterium]|nr:CDP-alcohol phosphatidyltransferase family protein [Sphingomonadaceae bacterium]